jgi:methyl-accepting chemotaxis protein
MRNLAHEAATQAALVGENGKGFAAVASDIQRLAERTASQVSSIVQVVQGVHEDIISATLSMRDTERKSSQGAKLAGEAGESLEAIFAAVEHQAREMDNINQVTLQQLQSFNAIENIISSIYQSTQQMITSTVGASQNLEYLVRHVEELHNSVEAFKLRQTSPMLGITVNGDPVTPQPSGVAQRLARLRLITPSSGANTSWG